MPSRKWNIFFRRAHRHYLSQLVQPRRGQQKGVRLLTSPTPVYYAELQLASHLFSASRCRHAAHAGSRDSLAELRVAIIAGGKNAFARRRCRNQDPMLDSPRSSMSIYALNNEVADRAHGHEDARAAPPPPPDLAYSAVTTFLTQGRSLLWLALQTLSDDLLPRRSLHRNFRMEKHPDPGGSFPPSGCWPDGRGSPLGPQWLVIIRFPHRAVTAADHAPLPFPRRKSLRRSRRPRPQLHGVRFRSAGRRQRACAPPSINDRVAV